MEENKIEKEDLFFIAENIDSGQRSSLDWVEESGPWGSLLGLEAQFLTLSLTKKKLTWFLAFILVGVSLLLARNFYLQIVKGGDYYNLAENNRLRVKYVKAHRGIIYDRNGKPLVQNVSGFSLMITPADLPKDQTQKDEVIKKVSEISGLSLDDINNQINSANKYYYQPIVIKTGIAYDQAMSLKIASSDLPGVSLNNDYWRQYFFGPQFSHLLGYVGKISPDEYENNNQNYLLSDNIGKTGLEKEYESYLRGQPGIQKVEIDALGQEKKIISETPFIPGDDLILTIDSDLQNKLYQIMDDKLKGSKAAVAIATDPRDGEVLAMVDYPSYDNNLFAAGISSTDYNKLLSDPMKPLYARSFLGEYPSGSTVKPVMATGALEQGIVTADTSFLSNGGLRLGQWFFPDWKAGGHGQTALFKAIAMSVNTYFYYIGGGYGDFKGLGLVLIDKYLTLFGLGAKTGIDLPSENKGLVPTADWKKKTTGESWYIGDTYHLSIGQGYLLVTPIQVNNYNSAIANGGTLFSPRLAMGVVHPDGTKEFFKPKVLGSNLASSSTLATVRRAMRETILTGSGRSLSTLSVEVAGKTGTAQWNTNKENHAWFNAFAPYQNPTFSITVLVEEGGEGNVIAAPIAKDAIDYWFTKNPPATP